MERNPANMVNLCADNLVEVALSGEKNNREYARKNIREWLNSYTKNSEVGVVLFNTNFHISYIPSEVWDTPWLRLDGTRPKIVDFVEDDWAWMYIKAHELGIEPYELAIEEAKKCGVEVWFSVRMNEFHFINKWEYSSPSLWVERPDLRISEDGPFDYEKEEVRDYYLRYIKELCTNYDIDGIELDTWRGENYFRKPITEEKTQILTDFFKEIRLAIDEICSHKGKRIKISARTSPHPAVAKQLGWDSAQWLADGSIDVLTLSNFFVPSTYEAEIEKWRQLISQKGVENDKYILNVASEMAMFCIQYDLKDARWKAADTEDLKGFAATHIDRGADGIYTYNITNRDYMIPLEERMVNYPVIMSQKEIYKGVRKHILTYDENGDHGGYKKHLMAKIKPNKEAEFELHTSRVPLMGTYTVVVGMNQKRADIEVYVNGKKCKYAGKLAGMPFDEEETKIVRETSETARCMKKYELTNLKFANDGMNNITIKCVGEEAVEITWLEVDVDSM